MTELAIRDETAVAAPPRPAAHLPVPAMSDIDSWTQIVGQVIRLANEIYDTPFVPDGLRGSAPAVAAAMLAGREMGLGPMTSLANIDVIRGKPTQKPLLMRAMILSRGHEWQDIDATDTRAVVRGKRKGETEWTTITFTADQAKRAGLDLGKYPGDKLYARATSRLAKHKFADVIMGMPSSDDVEDGVDVEVSVSADAAAPAAIEAARPRTAQRAARKAAPPAQAAPSAASPSSPVPAEDAGGALPPLPGEDEEVPTSGGAATSATAPPNGGDSSGTSGSPDEPVTNKQLTAIWTALTKDFEFTDDEKDMARAACGSLSGRGSGLPSTKELTKADAGTVIDTLAHLKALAEGQGEHPRSLLIALLAEREDGEVPGGE